jgi:hypothetical protein
MSLSEMSSVKGAGPPTETRGQSLKSGNLTFSKFRTFATSDGSGTIAKASGEHPTAITATERKSRGTNQTDGSAIGPR